MKMEKISHQYLIEELGFTKFSTSKISKPLFKDKPCDPIDALHLKPKKDLKNVISIIAPRHINRIDKILENI